MPTFRLTKRGTIQKNAAKTRDAEYGAAEWETYHPIWADVRPLTSQERVLSEQVVAGATHRIVFRFPHVQVTEEMRIIVDKQAYPILAVQDLNGEGQYLEVLTARRAAGAGVNTTR